MAQARMLNKTISLSKKLAMLKSDSARLLYTWLIPHLDIEGRFYADVDIIKGNVVPKLKMTTRKIAAYLNELAEVGLIKLYKADGEFYLQLENFKHFQILREDREAPSKIPPPEKCEPRELQENSRRTPGELQENSRLKLIEVKLKEENTYVDSSTPAHPPGKLESFQKAEKVEEIINLWNGFAEKVGLPQVRGITPGSKRERLLRARIKEKEFDFQKILEKVSRSEFLLGHKSDWKVSFDWLICPSNYVKVLEGNYDSNSLPKDSVRASRVGEYRGPKIAYPPGYWERVRELKKAGFEGERLIEKLREEFPEIKPLSGGTK